MRKKLRMIIFFQFSRKWLYFEEIFSGQNFFEFLSIKMIQPVSFSWEERSPLIFVKITIIDAKFSAYSSDTKISMIEQCYGKLQNYFNREEFYTLVSGSPAYCLSKIFEQT